jgi:hypothetical protein
MRAAFESRALATIAHRRHGRDPTAPGVATMKQLLKGAHDAFDRHKARSRASGHDFALAERIEMLHPAAWDALTSDASVLMSRRYLQVLEQHRPDNVLPRYAMAFDGARPVAAIVAQRVKITAERLRIPSGARKRDKLARVAAATFKHVEQDLLICGNLLSWGCHGVAFAQGIDPATAWPCVAEALYRIRRAEHLVADTDFVLVKDLTPSEAPGAATLRTYSYRRLETEPNMVLAIDAAWRGLDDYHAALASKYRKAARGIDKQVRDARLRVEALDVRRLPSDALHELYLQVHGAAALRLFTLRASFLPALGAAFGDDFRCSVIRDDDALLGFVTTLRDGDTAIAYYVGFDRERNRHAPLYLRLLQETIAHAIELRCTALSFGRTALEPKARLGAKPVPMEVWVRHRVPLLNLLVRAALGSVHHDEAPDRDPFKAS